VPDADSSLYGSDDPGEGWKREPYGVFDESTRELSPVGGVYGSPPGRWWRERRSAVAVTLSFLAVVAAGTATYVALRPSAQPQAIAPEPTATLGLPTSSGTATATVTPSAVLSPTQTPPPQPSRSHAVVPIPTQKPPPAELPPPPPPPAPSEAPSCQQWDPDNDAPRDVVRTALAQAGARNYWAGASKPQGWPSDAEYPPDMTLPAELMNAVAWTESSWRSTVIACDLGIGLMQVMPDTAPWMNQRFGRSYDVSTVDGNAALGAMYLQWLRMYFGLYYFGSFDLDVVEPVGRDDAPMRLGDVVLAAYNVGFGSVERDNGTPTNPTDDYLAIPNRWYVDRVLGYVQECPCDVP
jgi:hypothetical protein